MEMGDAFLPEKKGGLRGSSAEAFQNGKAAGYAVPFRTRTGGTGAFRLWSEPSSGARPSSEPEGRSIPFRTVFVLTGAGAFLAGRTPRALCGCCRAAFNVLASGPGCRFRKSAFGQALPCAMEHVGPSWRGRAEGVFTAALGPAAFRKAGRLPEAEREGVRRVVPAGHDGARGTSPHHS